MDARRPKRRWFQFSLLTLFVFVTLCAIPCCWLAIKMRESERQREAATAIEELGGLVSWSEPSGPMWLRTLLGDDFFNYVCSVVLAGKQVTDAGLEHLKDLSNLYWLGLRSSQITDSGLDQLKTLSQLEQLSLSDTQVTDAGLEHLKGLSQLQRLDLSDTQVTDAGLEYLKGLSQLKQLDLSDTQVTDAGLEYLKGLSQLQELFLYGTQVTNEGARQFKRVLPQCVIKP